MGPNATSSSDPQYTRREYDPYKPDDIRSEFRRDYTRIVHSRAFRRLRHKTQVFISPKNDHICSRMEHSLHVASVSQTIARALKLNEDLVEAIALGHDLGHAPFGHIGESSLNRIAGEHGFSFSHELHSLRVVDFLESPYDEHPGLNLTFAVRDGIVCHFGEGKGDENKFEKELHPDTKKAPDDLPKTRRGESLPATLEGCVVRWADKVAYLGRDLEDALNPEVGLVQEKDIPESVKKPLGLSAGRHINRHMIGRLVRELIASGKDTGTLSVPDDVHKALNELNEFNTNRIYRSEALERARDQVDRGMKLLFDSLLERLKAVHGNPNGLIDRSEDRRVLTVFHEFLTEGAEDFAEQPQEQLVIDYIAGMTDSFFRESFNELFLPTSVV
ncbi:MAG: hypothetical protein A2V70_00780 [Planctomycetes bacterium RBG_13_63_9]|nr:MAG: hypothetical protein A2V70_00780 [Planctomycetes bacterium RBG_13_63_9]